MRENGCRNFYTEVCGLSAIIALARPGLPRSCISRVLYHPKLAPRLWVIPVELLLQKLGFADNLRLNSFRFCQRFVVIKQYFEIAANTPNLRTHVSFLV
jgi:hypothetical protein